MLTLASLPPDSTHSHATPVVPVSQGIATASEIENAAKVEPPWVGAKEDAGSHTGVNFQTLLDNLSSGGTTAAASHLEGQSLHHAPKEESQNLPARPLDPSLNPNYASHSYEQPPPALATSSAYATHPSNHAQHFTSSTSPGGAPGTDAGAGSLPPPYRQGSQETIKTSRTDKQPVRTGKASDDDAPWGPEVQKKYDEFLHDERVYVTEGLWDRFPMGSRLFVGNLPTERVTKRDMFHLFHKYGKLAQISIKQAYGFIQFLEAGACHAALQVEQGALILKFRNRRGQPDLVRRRRLVPLLDDRGHQNSAVPVLLGLLHGLRVIALIGLPSPVGFHSVISGMNPRTEGVMTIGLHAHPVHLPLDLFVLVGMGIDHGTEPRNGLTAVDDPGLLARRAPLALPTLGIVGIAAPARDLAVSMKGKQVYRSLDGPHEMCRRCRNFILHVENAFRNRGLRVDVLVLGPRIPLGAAVHRQYVEGVLAVVRLSRPNQFSRKIPLQIFDRSAGPDNVRFSDYPEVDPNIAAEVMFHQAQAMQRGPVPTSFAPNPAFGVPPYASCAFASAGIANMISSLDGPSLHTLLSALQRPNPQSQPVSATQSPFSSPNPPPPADLASLLTNVTRPPVLPNPQPLPPPPYNLHPPNAPIVSDPHLLSLLAKGLSGQQPQGQPVGSNVQNLINHLAKWKQ
ncbi:RNA-binding protein (Nab3) [Penicillium atrosanguineum]|nr:RNA-binding protein (Nab3) [Penicillium atrosanguineum]